MRTLSVILSHAEVEEENLRELFMAAEGIYAMTEPYPFHVEQSGSRLIVSFPDFPGSRSFAGQARKTGNTIKPYRVVASTGRSKFLDCITSLESGG